MDGASSIITIVQAAFIVAVRLKNLTKESCARQEDITSLQQRAEKHARHIRRLQNVLSKQAPYSNDLYMATERRDTEKGLDEAALSFTNDLEEFQKELRDLEKEGNRQKLDIVVWGRSRVAPALKRIKVRIETHERDLNSLIQLHQVITIYELRSKDIEKQSPSLPSKKSRDISPHLPALQHTTTVDSEITLTGGPLRRASSSVPNSQPATDLPENLSSPRIERIRSNDRLELSPLLRAVSKGDEKEVRTLLDQKADIQVGDNEGRTVLHLAMKKPNNEALILLLLKNSPIGKDGLDLNAVDNDGNTALHLCADWNKGSIAKLLLEHEASPGIRDESGKTPLFYAIKKGYCEVVEVLLDGRAEVDKEHLEMTTSFYIRKLLQPQSKSRRCSELQPEASSPKPPKWSFMRRVSSVNG